MSEGPDRVPVRATGRKGEWPARRRPDQPSLGVEGGEEREEIELVGAAAVEEDERALRVARGRRD